MITRFDHVIIAARDLETAISLYNTNLGLDTKFGGRHTGRGTHNAITRFGLDYLEILAVADEQELLAAPAKRVRLLDFLKKREGGLLAYCLATDDIDGLAKQFHKNGLDALGPFDMERTRPDGLTLKWRLLIPGGSAYRQPWPFFIQWEMDDDERLSHEMPGHHVLGVTKVAGVSVTVADLEKARRLYSKQLGLELTSKDEVSELAMRRLRYRLGDCTIDLLSPDGYEPLQDELSSVGDGVYSITLEVASLDRAKQKLAEHGIGGSYLMGEGNCWEVEPNRVMHSRLWLTQA